MKSFLFFVSLVVLSLSIARAQTDFPPINSNGELFLEWDNPLSQDELVEYMQEFAQTYDTSQLKYLSMGISFDNISDYSAFSVLVNYVYLNTCIIIVEDISNYQVPVLTPYFPANITSLEFEFVVVDNLTNLHSFISNLAKYQQLQVFGMQFIDLLYLTQDQHDQLYSDIVTYVSSGIQELYFLFPRNLQIIATSSIKNLSHFQKLVNVQVEYPEVNTNNQQIDLTPIFDYVTSGQPALKDFSFIFDKWSPIIYNYAWIPYIQKMTFLDQLEIIIQGNLNYMDQPYIQNAILNITTLSQLKSLTFGALDDGMSISLDVSAFQKLSGWNDLEELIFEIVVLQINNFNISFVSSIQNLKNLYLFISSMSDPFNNQLRLNSSTLESLTLSIKSSFVSNYTMTLNTPSIVYENLYWDNFVGTQDTFLNVYWVSSQPYLRSLSIQITYSAFDASTIDFSKSSGLTNFSFYTEARQTYLVNPDTLGNLILDQNLTDIEMDCEDQNITFFQQYNKLKHLQTFSQQNVTHSYIQVNSSNVEQYSIYQCNEECLRCIGPNWNQCVSCSVYYLYNSECLATCPQGYHPNKVTNECDKDSIDIKNLRIQQPTIQQ